MFGAEQKKQKKKKTHPTRAGRSQSFSELSVGDYVVHESHGLGIYRGIEKIERDKVDQGLYENRVRGRRQPVPAGDPAGGYPEIRRGRREEAEA